MAHERWIVDGMNVVGSRPDGWWRDRRGAMARLVQRLAALAELDGRPVTVVFDGRPFRVAVARAGVPEVVFACRHGRGAADDAIVEMVYRHARPATLRVVTSDRDLSRRVSELGAEVEPARSFGDRLPRA